MKCKLHDVYKCKFPWGKCWSTHMKWGNDLLLYIAIVSLQEQLYLNHNQKGFICEMFNVKYLGTT